MSKKKSGGKFGGGFVVVLFVPPVMRELFCDKRLSFSTEAVLIYNRKGLWIIHVHVQLFLAQRLHQHLWVRPACIKARPYLDLRIHF